MPNKTVWVLNNFQLEWMKYDLKQRLMFQSATELMKLSSIKKDAGQCGWGKDVFNTITAAKVEDDKRILCYAYRKKKRYFQRMLPDRARNGKN